MIKCPNCGQEQDEGAKFCEGCGTELPEVQAAAAQVSETQATAEPAVIFCPNCGAKNSVDSAFCEKCGAPVTKESVRQAETAGAADKPGAKQPSMKKPSGKKLVLFGGGAAAVLAVILLAVLFSGGGKGGAYGMYLKDGEIYYSNFSKSDPIEITSRLNEGADNEDLPDISYLLNSWITFAKNGNLVFYPDRLSVTNYYDYTMTLYCRNLKKPNEEPIRVDSDVVSYSVNQDGTLVIYEKDGSLYSSDLTNKEKIASDIEGRGWKSTDDCKTVCYVNEDNDLYIWTGKDGKEKIASDVGSVEYISDDCTTFYYTKDGALYRQAAGQDREKIAGDVASVVCVYDSGEVYYVKSEEIEIDLMDYVRDDMSSSDAAMAEPQQPEYPSYPYSFYYSSVEEYNQAWEEYETAMGQYELDYQAYQEAYAAYREKQSRDRLRAQLEEASMTKTQYTLCFYDGKEEAVVTDALANAYSVSTASSKPVAVLPVFEQSEVNRVKLSEIGSAYEVQSQVEEAQYNAKSYQIAVGGVLSELDAEDPQNFHIRSEGNEIFFLDDVNWEKEQGELYHLTVSGSTVGKPELYDSDVSTYSINFPSDNSIVYYKDVSDGKGDLYLDKAQIDYDVQFYHYYYDSDAKAFYYITDWSSDKGYGTLKVSKNGTAEKIADDVSQACVLEDHTVLYLYDYSLKSYRGTLAQYKNGKTEKVDEDVIWILAVDGGTV